MSVESSVRDRQRERERIDFMRERDGEEAAIKWAEQTRAIYFRTAIEHSPYIASIMELEKFLEEKQGDQFRSWKHF
jgi:hypothetical protein